MVLGLLYVFNSRFLSTEFDIETLKTLDYSIFYRNIHWLIIAICLLPFNWILEAKKWHVVMDRFEKITFKNCLYSILTGVTCGLITPARLGEYVGRMLIVEKKRNAQAVYSSFICSLGQNTITLSIGIMASVLLLKMSQIININLTWLWIMNAVVLVFTIGLYFNQKWLLTLLSKIKYLRKYIVGLLEHDINLGILLKVLLLSGMRYLIYTFQYIAILYFFGIENSVWYNFLSISAIFMIQSSLPLPPIMSFIARGEIAVIVFSMFMLDAYLILLATTCLWIINLIVPALLGMVIILKLNITSSFGYE